MVWLIAARALQGVGGGGLNSLVMAIVGDVVAPRDRARHQATLGIVPAIAIVIGPVLGGLIVDHWNWTWIFLINVPLGGLALWMISSRLHLSAPSSPHRLDIAGALLAVVFTTCALLITSLAGQAFAWTSWPIIGLAVTTFVALPAYLLVEHRAVEPITPLSLFSNSIFVISALLFFLATAALFVGLLFVPLMLQTIFGHSAFVAGASIVPLLLGLIAASMVSGTLISKGARYKAFPIFGALLCGAGLGVLGFTTLDTSLWTVVAALIGLGSGLGLFIQVAVLAGQNAVAHRNLGVATGTLNFFKTMGGASGAAVLGAILAAGLAGASAPVQALAAFRHVFLDTAALMGVALLLAVLLREKPLSAEVVAIAEGRVDVPEY
ncbi:MFS transporter [Variovorax sp. E3]|uniref:MFS transporter n=1 Tax=Variovorax sp. E3 TaxID=1914993 RepID=UPI0018DD2288|nr:MFS transporter [Variovorax sp. E3]